MHLESACEVRVDAHDEETPMILRLVLIYVSQSD